MIESFENYLRVKFLEFENENKIDKKFKSFQKEFNEQFKDKITELKDITFDQEKFNSLISQLISDMSLDDNLEEEKIDEDDKDNEKKSEPQNQEQKAKEKDAKFEEMSIESGVPDLENEAEDNDKLDEGFEIEDSSRPDLRKKRVNNFDDIKYKSYTQEFDEVVKAEELENLDELVRLRKNLDQQLLQLKTLFLN